MRSRYFSSGIRLGLAVVAALIFAGTTLAATPVTQGFLARDQLVVGTIVSLDSNPGVVVPATRDNKHSLYGVVTGSDGSFISFSPDVSSNLQVANSGTEEALVSTVNGPIKVGDRITVSAIAGVGAKATESTKVVGVAQASFDDKSPNTQKQSVTDSKGKKHEFVVGRIPVLIGVSDYVDSGGKGKGGADGTGTAEKYGGVQQSVDRIFGRHVELAPLIAVFVIVLITLGVVGTVLYGAVTSSIISIGRNPFASKQVGRGLWKVGALVLIVVAAGIGASYAILQYV